MALAAFRKFPQMARLWRLHSLLSRWVILTVIILEVISLDVVIFIVDPYPTLTDKITVFDGV